MLFPGGSIESCGDWLKEGASSKALSDLTAVVKAPLSGVVSPPLFGVNG